MSRANTHAQKANGAEPSKAFRAVHLKPFYDGASTLNFSTTPNELPKMPMTGTLEHRALSELGACGPRGITSPEFQNVTGSWRLASAVCALRKKGWHIVDTWVATTRRRFKRYFLTEI